MHTDSPESQFRGLRWAAGNILVLLSLTDWSVAGCGVLMLTCEHVNNNVSGLKMSSKRSPSCRVRVSWSFWRKNSHFVTLCWVLSLLCLSLILCFFTIMHFDCVWRPHSFMFIQSFMLLTARLSHHISCERGIIFTPTESPTRLFWAVFLFFSSCDSSSPSGWHCDHGCHTTHAVFSKTAEDSLSHVTTASRLTCYHGDKPTNENSADGCAVDCKLFVLRGDLFFFFPPPPSPTLHSHSDADPATLAHVHVRTDMHTDKKNMGMLLTHMHIHAPQWGLQGCAQKKQRTKCTALDLNQWENIMCL